MRVSRGVVERLAASGIDTVFGIPGKQTLPLNEAIDRREDLRFVGARHETAVSHAAWGYAETSGRPAATLVVPGPGDMNALNGLKNAYNDCTPLVHLAVETEPDVRGGDGIHETPPEVYDPVVKSNTVIERPSAVAVELQRAIDTALRPPTGPVRVGIPKNFLTEDRPLATASRTDDASSTPVPQADIEDAATCLAGANRPAILVGGGVRTAEADSELLAVADRLDAPVVTTYKGKGVIPDSNDRVAGTLSGSAPPELLDCLASSDALLAVGTDFDAVATRGWSVETPDEIVHITLSPGDLGTGYDLSVGIVADAADALDALDEVLESHAVGDGGGRERATAVREAMDDRVESLLAETTPLSSVRALRAVREAVPEETVVSVDAGGFRVWALNTFDASGPRRYVNPGSWATMGTGLPAALGAQIANPDRDVLALAGDGGLLMSIHELHTAASEGIPVTVVVFRNDDYAIITEEAGRSFGIQDGYDWSETPLDFVTIAAGMGVEATRAETPAEIDTALSAALDSDEPRLVEVPTDPDEPQASEWLSPDDESPE
ncbi:thiamine pyrophosphate-binding protein [Halovenus sp. WSH3]|uniref:Thiamine pyrophosphate-binding protein n=1 Tax=Halovenus carboxidivorans TaxID=2692199 RepID=A0A6B0T1R4_9EURY|nr:thiamine pyrophosphate-binding protein [Halovenus carboxidivorans]MXR51994.1 thiamine pyrophosphate-binding protein [Halovenus carboxidivorans]